VGLDSSFPRRLARHGHLVALLGPGSAIIVQQLLDGADVRVATVAFVAASALLSGFFVVVCWLTGEPPIWPWGD
jgi:hypothetical protein